MGLNFKKSGRGPSLVLIHGLFGSLENLGGIARLLQDQFTVYSVDLPNHGRSPHSNPSSLPLMSEQVAQWMATEGLHDVYILGHSLGGKVGMELALTHPALVRKLVVMDIAPIAYGAHHDDVFSGLLALEPETLASRKEADEKLAAYVPELPVRSFLLKNLNKTPDGFQWRMNLPTLHRCYAQLIQANKADVVFDKPTLFLKGGNSPYIREEHREAILSRFPKTQLKVVANTGHWLHAEKPEIVAKLAEKFLSAEDSE